MQLGRYSLYVALMAACTGPAARAQITVTPVLGVNLAGDAEFRRGGGGLSIGYLGERLGFELEAQRHIHLFKDKNVDLVPNNCGVAPLGSPCIDLNTRAWSYMANVMVPIRDRMATWHPYGTVGLGVIHPWIEGPGDQYDVAQNDLALDVGGGIRRSMSKHVGIRSDLRYFRGFVDKDASPAYDKDYGFVRLTIGLTFAFLR
jgi:hypothetical protein